MTRNAPAAEVRTWLVAHPKSLAKVSAKGQATVLPDADGNFPKGRLAAEAFGVFNKSQRLAVYAPGNTHKAEVAAAKAALKARQRAAKKGHTGTRGPLPLALRPKV